MCCSERCERSRDSTARAKPLSSSNAPVCACVLCRVAMSVAELESVAAELERRQAELRLGLKRARQRLASESPRPCTPWMREVAVRVLVLSGFNDEAVLKFLTAKSRAEAVACVREWHGALSPDLAAKLIEPGDDPAACRQLAEARRFVEEFRLVAWVKEQNSEKGIAPSASAVLEQAGPALVRSSLRRNRYRWVKRCMNRWGGRRVRLGGGDQLSEDEFGRKAPPPVTPRSFRRFFSRP